MIRLALLPQSMLALSVLLTYLVHSGLWFLAAWAASHPALGLSSAARSRIWRAALIGPVLGTVLALAVADGWRAPAVELTLATAPAAEVLPVPPAPAIAGQPADLDPEGPMPLVLKSPPLPAAAMSAPPSPPSSERPLPLDLGTVVLLALAAAAACRLVILGVRHLRFWRRLRGRKLVHGGPAAERLRELAAVADLPFPVRLSISPLARGPMALGRGEICLPSRALDDLPGPALSAVLAHEIAHLERQDNAWLTAGALIEAVLFFQPLTRIARRQLSAAAELACDERAVELTASPVDLARSIAIVAAWQLGRHEAVPVVAMARTPIDGDIVDRVKRLLAEPLPGGPGGGQGRVVLGVLVACGLLAPAIGGPGELQAGVPMPLPKATQAANRFLAPPAVDSDWQWQWDGDWDFDEPKPRRRPRRVREPRAPMPPLPPLPPLPPMAALPAMPPTPPLPPMPASTAHIGEVAARMAELGMRLAELHASRAGENLTEADQAKVKQIERQMEGLRKQLEAEEKRFARDMDEWGKRYEQQFGKDFERKMEAWGEEYGKRMEQWQRQHGRAFEQWNRALAWRTGEAKRFKFAEKIHQRQEEEVRQAHEQARRVQEKMRRRWEEERQQREEMRRDWEDARRQQETLRREDQERARHAQERARHAEERARHDQERAQHAQERARHDQERARKAEQDRLERGSVKVAPAIAKPQPSPDAKPAPVRVPAAPKLAPADVKPAP